MTLTTIYSDGTTVYNKQSVDNQINGALADLNVYKYDANITDANACYVNGKITRYILSGSAVANLPDSTNAWMLETNGSDVSFSGNHYGYQIAEMVGVNRDFSARYTRKKYGPTNWGSWERLATNSDVINLQALKLRGQWSTFAQFISDIPTNFSGLRIDAVVQQNVVDNDSPSPTKNYYWWNVVTLGTYGRLAQIAVNSYVGYPTSAHVYVRAKHDNTWSGWREL